jgi:predicted ATPase
MTIIVGENGVGKSSLIEAIAEVCRLPVQGGGRTEMRDMRSDLARGLSASFVRHVHDGYFVRAENLVRLADLLEDRKQDPDFRGDPYRYYGGRSMHEQSHGEAFLSIFKHRLQSGGVIIMDEPESALSATRQLELLALLWQFIDEGNTQVFIATHSPILMTFPGASLLEISDSGINPIRLQDTSHYQITRSILENPER